MRKLFKWKLDYKNGGYTRWTCEVQGVKLVKEQRIPVAPIRGKTRISYYTDGGFYTFQNEEGMKTYIDRKVNHREQLMW